MYNDFFYALKLYLFKSFHLELFVFRFLLFLLDQSMAIIIMNDNDDDDDGWEKHRSRCLLLSFHLALERNDLSHGLLLFHSRTTTHSIYNNIIITIRFTGCKHDSIVRAHVCKRVVFLSLFLICFSFRSISPNRSLFTV